MNASRHTVKGLVSDIRKRWRRRALIQGGALTLLTLLFFATVLLLLYTSVTLKPPHLLIGVGVAAAAVLGVLALFVFRPGLRRLSDRQIALFVEEKIPELEDRLNSAVEVNDEDALRKEHSALIDQLIDDAARQTRAIPMTTVVDRKRERLLTYTAAGFLGAFLLFGYTTLDKIQFTASGVDLSALTEAARPFMTVSPGSVEIEKGASQEIIVTLRDDTDDDVVLVYKEGDGEWKKEAMQRGLDDPTFLQEFFDIQEPIQYYVEFGETRSEPYLLSLYEFPEVGRIDLAYTYPDYTGLAPRTEEDTGDIRGLKGSTVAITLRTTGTVETAELVLNDERTLLLEPLGEGRFRGRLTLDEPGYYVAHLTDAAGKNNKFPDEYRIEPVEDEKPYITITDPQRDVRANAIEEVLVAASVQDDYGVKDLRLTFSVNGDDEQTLRLMDQATERPLETAGEHLFYLEDYSLVPGDVISYYLEAEDYFHTDAPEATDMYFIEVIPFDQKFSQVNNTGGMQGGQPSGIVLSQQQIIAATWKLHRERSEMEGAEVEEALDGLVQAQSNLKNNIEERINSTAFSLELRNNEDQQQVVEWLRQATGEMDRARIDLRADRLKKALTPERKALNYLLRADALNKEQQVTMNRGGGGQSATEERMTELMDLELDISKDKYEMQQQRAQQQQDQQLDETLNKLRELARRQQNLANQNRPEDLEGEDKKRFIDKLKRDQDELRRQSEQLADNMRQMARNNDQISQQMQQRMERIAENMREAEQALRRNDPQRAMARQQQALNELQRLEQEMRLSSTDNSREMIEDLAQQFDQFRDQERQLGRDIEEAAEEARLRQGRTDQETVDRLQQKRQQMLDNLERLMDQAEAVQERIQQDDPELARTVRNILQQVRRERLEENMRNSEEAIEEGWLDYAERMEDEILATIERLETQRRAFEQSLPLTDEEQLTRSLEEIRNLMRQFEQMQNQAQAGQQGNPNEQQNQQQGQQQGRAGSPSDRQARADAARMQRQLERAQETLERLQRDLGNNPAAQNQIRRLQNLMNRADNTGILLEGDAAKAFFNDRVYDPLSQLELEVARQLDLIEMEKKLYGGRKTDVPAEYRDLVEKYYESLAKTRERQR
ncbi:MAG: DUF4175 family protein [Rhodothermales bacterium]